MTKATDLLETLALKASVKLHVEAALHRSRARRYENRLTGPDALRKSRADIDLQLAKAEEKEALSSALSNAVNDVRIQRMERVHARKKT